MKSKLMLLSFLLVCSQVIGQNFEGKVTYEVKFDAAGNPGMESLSSIPMKMQISIKGNKSRMRFDMGLMVQDIIFDNEKNKVVMVIDALKTAYVLNIDNTSKLNSSSEKIHPKPIITKHNEFLKIAGFDCRKYTAKIKVDNRELIKEIWVYEGSKIPVPKQKSNIGGVDQIMIEGIEGIPMKVSMDFNQAGVTMKFHLTAISLEQASVSDDEFVIPNDYKVENGLPATIIGTDK